MKQNVLKFQIGSYISFNTIEIGRVVGTATKSLGGEALDCYVVEEELKVATKSTPKHFIPIRLETAIRPLLNSCETKNVLEKVAENFSLKFIKTVDKPSRYKFLTDELKNSSFEKLAEVVHYLMLLDQDKKISASEKKLLKMKKEQFIREAHFITQISEEEIENQLLVNLKLIRNRKVL